MRVGNSIVEIAGNQSKQSKSDLKKWLGLVKFELKLFVCNWLFCGLLVLFVVAMIWIVVLNISGTTNNPTVWGDDWRQVLQDNIDSIGPISNIRLLYQWYLDNDIRPYNTLSINEVFLEMFYGSYYISITQLLMLVASIAIVARVNTVQYTGSVALGLYALPTPRYKILWAKIVVSTIMIVAISLLMLIAIVVIGGIHFGFDGLSTPYIAEANVWTGTGWTTMGVTNPTNIWVAMLGAWGLVSVIGITLSTLGILLSVVTKKIGMAVGIYVVLLIVLVVLSDYDHLAKIPNWILWISPYSYLGIISNVFYNNYAPIRYNYPTLCGSLGVLVGIGVLTIWGTIVVGISWWLNNRQEIK
jgi:ABC-2 type transport system permease protein